MALFGEKAANRSFRFTASIAIPQGETYSVHASLNMDSMYFYYRNKNFIIPTTTTDWWDKTLGFWKDAF